jgi:hypothetical protein
MLLATDSEKLLSGLRIEHVCLMHVQLISTSSMPSLLTEEIGDRINVKSSGDGSWEIQFDKSNGLVDFWKVR